MPAIASTERSDSAADGPSFGAFLRAPQTLNDFSFDLLCVTVNVDDQNDLRWWVVKQLSLDTIQREKTLMGFRRFTTILLGTTVAFTATGLLAFAAPAMADGTTADGFVYTTSGTEATITGYTSTNLDAVIPDTIDEGATTYTVTAISGGSFNGEHLTSVIIPSTVTTIGDWAFNENDLSTVIIPDSVTSIGERAFYNNSLLTVTLGTAVVTIGNSAFASNSLSDIILPASLVTIGTSAFSGNDLIAVTIPDAVTTIGGYAFFQNDLTTVTIPDAVTTIGEFAFYDNGLTSVNLGNSVSVIRFGAFQDNALTTVTIPSSVVSIGFDAFSDNTGLESAVFNGDAPGTVDSEIFGPATSIFTVFYYEGATGFANPWTADGYATEMISLTGSTLTLSPAGTVLADGTTTFTATLTVMAGTPSAAVAGLPVAFTIPAGVTASASDCVTDASGICTFTITSTTAGTYTIGALANNVTAAATFNAVPALAATGAETSPLPYAIGGGLLVLGILFTVLAIRRRNTRSLSSV